MSTLHLKTLLRKKKPIYQTLSALFQTLPGPIGITDPTGKVLLGSVDPGHPGQPILLANREVGTLYAPPASAKMAADLMDLLLQKESERKEMGYEVLQLYREINLIYDFSEELATTIDPRRIGEIALQQARKLIPADAGRILLLSDNRKSITLLAASGTTADDAAIIQEQKHILDHFLAEIKADIIPDARQDQRTRDLPIAVASLIYAPLKAGEDPIGLIVLGTQERHQYKANDLKILNTLALQTASAIQSSLLYEKNIQEIQAREAELQRINEAARKFVPHDFIRLLGRESIQDIMLGDQVQKVVTVMFIDIRDYTTFSEGMTPQENFTFLNSYIGRVGQVINYHGGMIMSFLGDGILALFLDGTDQAMQAAVSIQKSVQAYNQERPSGHRRLIQIGIGMHQGPLIMGILGNERRQEANLVSDTVNTASRMEGLTKYYGTNIIASESVVKQAHQADQIAFRSLGKVQVKGKNHALEIFDIYESDRQEVFDKKHTTRETFHLGLRKYNERCFEQATAAFAQVLSINPEDRAAQLYLNNAVQYHTSGVGTDWEGVEIMEIK